MNDPTDQFQAVLQSAQQHAETLNRIADSLHVLVEVAVIALVLWVLKLGIGLACHLPSKDRK